MKIKKIGILYHPKVESTRLKADELEGFLKTQGTSVWTCSAWETGQAAVKMKDTDLLLTVGGDGTILRGIQAVIPAMTPVTGINQGKLGFMTELSNGEAVEKLPQLIAGQGWTDERAMLQAEFKTQGKAPQTFHALNDIVVARGPVARLINVEVSTDGQKMPDYRADAVIAATATGSTGYALAARGPIMYPQSPDFILVPVAPHLSPAYPIVLSQKSEVTLKLKTYMEATLSIDGHINLTLVNGDTVTIRRSPYIARFRRLRPENSFLGTLEEKLKGRQSDSGRKG
jgi:NAD+ kinase